MKLNTKEHNQCRGFYKPVATKKKKKWMEHDNHKNHDGTSRYKRKERDDVIEKGNPINFTHYSVFTGLGEYYCICE